MSITVDLPLSPKQLDSIRAANGRVNIWDGSIRSGKTIASLIRWLIFIATAPRTGELVIIGRTRDSAWRNVIGPLQTVALFGSIAKLVVGNYGAPTVLILGRRVHILGAHDAKAEAVIRGLTIAGALVDEATVIPAEFFTQLLGRMSVRGAQLFATTNPDNPAHWLKATFLDRLLQLPDWRRFQFTLDDNPSLDSAYVASIKREYVGLWYRRFILGEWVAAEGAVYPMWDPDRHVVDHAKLPDMQRLIGVGIDYGTTNATAALLLGLGLDRRLYLVDEWRHDPKQTSIRLTDADLSKGIRTWLTEPHLPERPGSVEPRIEWVVIDPSAASLREQMFRDRVEGLALADNDVAYGIRTFASGLGGGWLKVSDRCTGFIGEVPGYSWDAKASAKGEDKPVKVADHSLDAARYIVTTTEALWRSHTDTAAREAAKDAASRQQSGVATEGSAQDRTGHAAVVGVVRRHP